MYLLHIIQSAVVSSLTALYGESYTEKDFQLNETKPDFEGDYTVVLFSLLKKTGKPLTELGPALGDHLLENNPQLFTRYNIIKGFLNFTISDTYWLQLLQGSHADMCFGTAPLNGKTVMVEYSSPNTNKPLHLGHLRNNFLGWSIGEIFRANGYKVIKTSIVNDRGVHICKSMYAWQQFANGETPASSGKKGDHLVGEYYVKFEQLLKKQAEELLHKEAEGEVSHYDEQQQQKVIELQQQRNKLKEENTEKNNERIAKIDTELSDLRRAATSAMKDVTTMLQEWEAGKPEVKELWATMNGWVYEGMGETYKMTGIDFDKTYYESNTYLTGKDIVAQGLGDNIFYKREDGSVWIDLTKDGLDEKLLLRRDGTSVYMTQDIGLAKQKYDEYGIDRSIYVIGDEQNYHMKVLQLICEKLEFPYAKDIQHLSYGMVELPHGKMKSREGTVVDADDIVAEMIDVAKAKTEELGKVKDFEEDELKELYKTIGLGALKFYLLRVDPKKKMVFNPEESIDFHGFTAPFIQFNHARIRSILRKENFTKSPENHLPEETGFLPLEKKLILELEKYGTTLVQAGEELNPSVIANYVYNVAKTFSSFYTEHSIANAENEVKKSLRLQLAAMTANVMKNGMSLLGINMPEKM